MSRSFGELIGREREVELLGEHRRAASDGSGRFLLLGGEAGIGKSRLLNHFTSSVAARSTVAAARCIEFVQTPMSPLRDLLEQLERRGNAPRDAITSSLVDRLAFERGGRATDSPPSGALFESIEAAFARYALHGTIVLSIEDLHWADRSTLAFLAYLADRVEKRRILAIGTYRSNEIRTRHPQLSQFATLLSKPEVYRIGLTPLSESATRTLVERRLSQGRTLPLAVVATIAKRSQGNPFFAEELVKSALEAGDGRTKPDLPLSIRAAVLARAAELSEAEREIISMAAVLGERFSAERLVALVGGNRGPVVRALEHARVLQLLDDEHSDPGRLAFRHALTQEVLYDELLAERVRPLHEAIATELESRPARDEVSVELAHHWRRAGYVDRAAAYDEIAGDRAVEIGAFADAVVYYESALQQRKDVPELVHKTGAALGALNQLSASIERLRQAAELYWRAEDFQGFAKNASALGAQLYNSGNAAAATRVYQQALEALTEKLPHVALDLFRARIAYNFVAALDACSALTFLCDIVEPITDPMTASQAYLTRFKVAAMGGDVEQWRAYAERALEAARQLGDVGYSRLRNAHCQIALDALGLGEVESAREHFRAAMPAQRERHSSTALVSAASALEHTLRGDFAGAQSLLHDASTAPEQGYAILVHVKSAHLALGICWGDDARLRSEGSESFLRYGVEHGMKLAIGLLGGPYAWALGIRGLSDEAAAWISRISEVLPGPHRFLFAYLAAAQFGRGGDVLTMRPGLLEAASRRQDRVNKAVLGLFDAFAAERGIVKADARTCALAAARSFEAIGWPWFAARAYESAGESLRALEMFRSLGSVRDVRRLEVERFGSAASALSVLSSREAEVAELVSKGHSNEEISQILHISSRTAEKHVSSALKKLDLRSRLQLGRLLARSETSKDPL